VAHGVLDAAGCPGETEREKVKGRIGKGVVLPRDRPGVAYVGFRLGLDSARGEASGSFPKGLHVVSRVRDVPVEGLRMEETITSEEVSGHE
jgi:hypothetical protein